jgi:hypothetical protein
MESEMNAPEDTTTADPTDPATPAAPPRRPYAKPVLVTYGDVVTLTESVGFSGKSDGGKGFRRRTR